MDRVSSAETLGLEIPTHSLMPEQRHRTTFILRLLPPFPHSSTPAIPEQRVTDLSTSTSPSWANEELNQCCWFSSLRRTRFLHCGATAVGVATPNNNISPVRMSILSWQTGRKLSPKASPNLAKTRTIWLFSQRRSFLTEVVSLEEAVPCRGAIAGVTVGANPGRNATPTRPHHRYLASPAADQQGAAWESGTWWFRIKEPPVTRSSDSAQCLRTLVLALPSLAIFTTPQSACTCHLLHNPSNSQSTKQASWFSQTGKSNLKKDLPPHTIQYLASLQNKNEGKKYGQKHEANSPPNIPLQKHEKKKEMIAAGGCGSPKFIFLSSRIKSEEKKDEEIKRGSRPEAAGR
ncbi:hypothetical protein B0H13DRAFT_1876304 [Mycena leptocephala]|nr:hypothetical protein B0H13DRAFT_1876304 [Mycena leptocephala]